MSLKDYKSDINLNGNEPIGDTSHYRDELNSLRIDKLSNRVTIISIIIPCLIGAVLFFAYMDMKEQVLDVDTSKQSQVEQISELFDSKLNALDVRIARNRFDLDKELPEIKNRATQIEGLVTKTANTKMDKKDAQAAIASIEKKINTDLSKIKADMQALEAENNKALDAATASMKKLDDRIKDISSKLSDAVAGLAKLTDQLAWTQKQLSIVDKRQKDLESARSSQPDLEKQIAEARASLLKKIQEIEDQLDTQIRILDHKILENAIKIQKPPIQSDEAPPDDETLEPGVIMEESLGD